MAINFNKVGAKLMQLAEINSEKFQVRYNRNGINALSKSDSKFSEILEDVFVGCSKPVLEINARPKVRRNVVNMATKDGAEVITDMPLLFSKEDNILDMLPKTVGRLKKVVLNAKEAKEILLKDEDLRMYFARPFYSAKNPVLEISSKNEGKFQIVAISIKDDDRTVARGAYSISRDKNGKKVKKYHFYNESSVISGNNIKGKNPVIDLLPLSLKKRIAILSDFYLSEREKFIINEKYALNGSKGKSEKQIGDIMCLTKERINQIIQKTLRKVKAYDLTPEDIRIYEKYSRIPKYLNKDEVISYKNFLSDLLAGGYIRENALDSIHNMISISEIRAKKKAFNVIHDIPMETKEIISPSPITEVFVVKE